MKTLTMATVLWGTFLCSATGWSQDKVEKPDVAKFDTNGDGMMSGAEFRRAIPEIMEGAASAGDTNKDGELTDAELDAYVEKVAEDWKKLRETLEEDGDELDRAPLPLAFLSSDYFSTKDPQGLFQAWGPKREPWLLLRGSHVDASILTASPTSDDVFKKAEAAKFSYARGFDDNADDWVVRGALIHRIWREDQRALFLSASFDRVESESTPKTNTNNFVPRLTGEWRRSADLLDHYTRARVAYATDFDGDSGVGALELEWEPVFDFNPLANGSIEWVPFLTNVVGYRTRQFIHGEFGQVYSSGGRATLEKDDEFTRLGPWLELEILPVVGVLNNVTGRLRWADYTALGGDATSTRMFEASLETQLDQRGHATLELNYRNGDTPLLDQEVNQLTVSLGLKF